MSVPTRNVGGRKRSQTPITSLHILLGHQHVLCGKQPAQTNVSDQKVVLLECRLTTETITCKIYTESDLSTGTYVPFECGVTLSTGS